MDTKLIKYCLLCTSFLLIPLLAFAKPDSNCVDEIREAGAEWNGICSNSDGVTVSDALLPGINNNEHNDEGPDGVVLPYLSDAYDTIARFRLNGNNVYLGNGIMMGEAQDSNGAPLGTFVESYSRTVDGIEVKQTHLYYRNLVNPQGGEPYPYKWGKNDGCCNDDNDIYGRIAGVPNGSPTVRWIYKFTNTGAEDTEPYGDGDGDGDSDSATLRENETVEFEFYGNLGSDSSTQLHATYDGDSSVESTDIWFISSDVRSDDNSSDDEYEGPRWYDPFNTFVVQGANCALAKPHEVSLSGDNVSFKYRFNIPMGETRYVIVFATLSYTGEQAVSSAATFESDAAIDANRLFDDLDPAERGKFVNFSGSFPCGPIGDTIWYDRNGNGVQDAEEGGISGIPVTLYNEDDSVFGTDMTDTNGSYLFPFVRDGHLHSLGVDYPKEIGVRVSPKYQGGNNDTDSDLNPETNRTDVFKHSGDGELNIDGGLYIEGVLDSDLDGIPNTLDICPDVATHVADATGIVDCNVAATISDILKQVRRDLRNTSKTRANGRRRNAVGMMKTAVAFSQTNASSYAGTMSVEDLSTRLARVQKRVRKAVKALKRGDGKRKRRRALVAIRRLLKDLNNS